LTVVIIIMRHGATEDEIAHVVERLEQVGAQAHVSPGQLRTVIGAIGDREQIHQLPWEAFPGVERAVPVLKPFKFVSRDFQPDDTVIEVGGAKIGGGHFAVIAGPCAVESREQLFQAVKAVREAGATILRGDAYKPRTSPYSFQGLGEAGLEMMAEAREASGLPFVAEVVDPRDVDRVSSYADIVRVGTRNMANFTLLTEVGRQPKPVLLKRGFTSTVDELLNAAEYVYKEGNHQVILCERGIRTFETSARNTLDITAVPVCKLLSHLPIVVDPSHATGKKALVPPLARAALVSGADGFMVDVHPAPEVALVDGAQALLPEEFATLMDQVRQLAEVMGLKL
jgi:3-deoxy-7-phosphoheptulonate synthase